MKRSLRTVLPALALACAHAETKPEQPEAASQSPAATPTAGTQSAAPGGGAPAAPPAPVIRADAKQAYAEGVSEAQSGDCASARGKFESALDKDGRLAWAAYDLGVCDDRLGDPGRAMDAYRRALMAKPDFVEADENLTRLQLRLGRAPEAEAEVRRRLSQPNAPVAFHTQLAEVLAAEQRFDEAATEAKVTLKADERNVPAMLVLAGIYYDQHRNELSRMVSENARQIEPSNARVYNQLGALDLVDKNRNMALENFKKAAELREDFAEAQNNLGALLVSSQDFPGAIHHLELAVRDAPESVASHLNLGNAYRGNKQYDQAKTEYNRVLQLDPSQADAYFNLGVLYLDGDPSGTQPIDRLNQSIAYFDSFRKAGGQDAKLDQYVKDAQKAISQEKHRQELEARNKLRKEAEAKKKETEVTAKQSTGPAAPNGSKIGSGTGAATPPAPTPTSGDKLQGGK